MTKSLPPVEIIRSEGEKFVVVRCSRCSLQSVVPKEDPHCVLCDKKKDAPRRPRRSGH